MKKRWVMKKRGVFFSTDALIALIIIFLSILIIYPVIKYVPEKNYVQEDILKVLSSLRIDEIDNDYVLQLINEGNITNMNNSVLEQIGEFYVTDLSIARTLADSVLGNINARENVGIWYGNKLLASRNITSYEDSKDVILARRIISGIREGESVTGFSSRAFLQSNIRTNYFYFGGYVGEGNISVKINYTGQLDNVKIEIASEDDFDVYINGIFSGHYANSSSDFVPVEYSLGAYESNFNSGDNILEFVGEDLHIAGGYIKVTYDDGDYFESSEKRYNFPGIEGLINLYDGFYFSNIPDTMTINLHLDTDYITFLTIGNVTVFKNNTIGEQTIILDNAELSSKLNYLDLVNKTVPIRLGMENVSYVVNQSRNANVFSVTDLSGSMYGSKLTNAKSANEALVDVILNVSGNNLGLVGYRSTASDNDFHNLSQDDISLKNEINSWSASGGTCICCGINKAKENLEDGINVIERKSDWRVSDMFFANWNYISFDDSSWDLEEMPDFLYYYSGAGITKGDIGIAVMGDYNNQIEDLLISQGFGSVSSYSRNDYSSVIADIDNFDVIVLHRVDSLSGFDNLINEAETKGKGILFASSYPHSSYGMGVLSSRSNNPDDTSHDWGDGAVEITIQQSHAIFQGYSQGEKVIIINGGDNDYQWYFDYSGDTIATHARGDMIGIDEIKKHAILGSFGATGYTNVNDWTEDGKQIFENVVLWLGGIETSVNTGEYYLRKEFSLSEMPIDVEAYLYVDDFAEIYLNEELIYDSSDDSNGTYWDDIFLIDLNKFRIGTNVLAVKLTNNENSSGGFDLEMRVSFENRYKSMIVMSDGGANYQCSEQGTGSATQDAIQAACDAYDDYGITVHAVGFGIGADETTLQGIADCGNGSYYFGDLGDIVSIYQEIGGDIIEASYNEQTIKSSANIVTKFYSDSYIEFDYVEPASPYGLIITGENQFTDSSYGYFDIPEDSELLEAKVISYSGPRWTDNVEINNVSIYSLSDYGSDYIGLGDPYYISIPTNFVNSTNSVKVTTGYSPGNSTVGSIYNKIIYQLIKNVTSYSPISSSAEGCNWVLDFELSNLTLAIPLNYSGENYCYYQEGNRQYDENDAIQRAVFYLLEELDFDGDGRLDVKFSEQDLSISSSEIVGIPFGWSTEVQVRKWH